MNSKDETAPSPVEKPSGRRPSSGGSSDTREDILDAAIEMFSASGIETTSVRSIATRAGVDPGLIRYFFTDKETLFAAAVTQRTEIPHRIAHAFAGDSELLGCRIADTYLGLWEDPDTGPILNALFRSAMTHPRAGRMFIETLNAQILPGSPLSSPTSPEAEGFVLAITHLLGIAVARYVLKVPAATEVPRERIVERVGSEIQDYLHPFTR